MKNKAGTVDFAADIKKHHNERRALTERLIEKFLRDLEFSDFSDINFVTGLNFVLTCEQVKITELLTKSEYSNQSIITWAQSNGAMPSKDIQRKVLKQLLEQVRLLMLEE